MWEPAPPPIVLAGMHVGASEQQGSRAGGGNRRRLVADLNLVPYIDLLTCMVAFLLITAVWTQLARLEVRQKAPGIEGSENGLVTPKVMVLVVDDGFSIVVDQDRVPLARTGADYDFTRLALELGKVKRAMPDKDDVQVASADAVDFATLVRTMDTVLGAGFPDVTLVEAARTGL
jgi:biopolymer transport protein TolR